MTTTVQPVDGERLDLPSASRVERIVNCPGSPAAEAQCPPEPSTEVAEEGTDIHDALAEGDTESLALNPAAIAQHLQTMEADALADWLAFHNVDHAPPRFAHQRYWMRDHLLKPIASGEIDVGYVLVEKQAALIGDFKTGYLDQATAPENWQLRTLAIVVWHEFDKALQHIRVFLASHRFRSKLDPCDYTATDLKHAEHEILHAFWRANQPNAPRHAGPWCRYCRAKAYCVEAAAYSMVIYCTPVRAVREAIDPVQRAAMLTPPQLSALWSRKGEIAAIYKAIGARLQAMPEADLNAIGLKRKSTGSSTTITDIQQAFALLYNAGLCTEEQFRSWCKLTLGPVEKHAAQLLHEKAAGAGQPITVEDAKKKFRALLAPVIASKPKAPAIVDA